MCAAAEQKQEMREPPIALPFYSAVGDFGNRPDAASLVNGRRAPEIGAEWVQESAASRAGRRSIPGCMQQALGRESSPSIRNKDGKGAIYQSNNRKSMAGSV